MQLQIILVLALMLSAKFQPGKNHGFISPPTGKLTVEITGFHSDAGEVSVALYNQAGAFPKQAEKAVAIVYAKINSKKSEVVFNNLAAGEYAVSVFHDENNNKKMDSNLFGIPKEGVGASNNAKGHFGPPKYENAKFFFNGSDQKISISISYL